MSSIPRGESVETLQSKFTEGAVRAALHVDEALGSGCQLGSCTSGDQTEGILNMTQPHPVLFLRCAVNGGAEKEGLPKAAAELQEGLCNSAW